MTIPMSLMILAATLAAASDPATADDALRLEQAKAQMVRAATAKVQPSIVTIETIGGAQPIREGPRGPMEEGFRVGDGPTTGVVISPDGLIITSSFNFVRAPTVITVLMADGRRFVATLLGTDQIRRLTLLKVEADELPTPQWATAAEIRVGQFAIACGRGLGGTSPFVSLGIVSALQRRNGMALQTDAKVSPINYGGPLVDINGRVMGILVPMAGAGGALAGAQWYDSGIGFAIYKDRIDAVIGRLRAGQTLEPGRIGVVLDAAPTEGNTIWEEFFPQTRGVRIRTVADESPAKKADLKVDDLITALDGSPVGSFPELQRKLSDRAAGEQVKLSIKRRWKKFDVTITLARSADIGALIAPTTRSEQPEESPATQPATD